MDDRAISDELEVTISCSVPGLRHWVGNLHIHGVVLIYSTLFST
jgi:hypothetical protein